MERYQQSVNKESNVQILSTNQEDPSSPHNIIHYNTFVQEGNTEIKIFNVITSNSSIDGKVTE